MFLLEELDDCLDGCYKEHCNTHQEEEEGEGGDWIEVRFFHMDILSVFAIQLIELLVDLLQLLPALVHCPAIVLCFSCLVEVHQHVDPRR